MRKLMTNLFLAIDVPYLLAIESEFVVKEMLA